MRVRSKVFAVRLGEHGEIIAHWDKVGEFCGQHKGKAAFMRIELQPTEPSEKTKNYFYGYIVPELRNAFMENGEHLTKEQTYNRIREICPLFSEQTRENGQWRTHLKEFEDLDQAEANEVIDFLFQWAAENLFLILENPNG